MDTEKCKKIWAWWVPVLLTLFSVLIVWGQYKAMLSLQTEADMRGEWADDGWVIKTAFWLLVVCFCGGLVWLVGAVITCVRQQRWWGLIGRFISVCVFYNVWCVCAIIWFMLWAGGGPDSFADDLQLPPDRELVCPRYMDGEAVKPEDTRAGRVRELCALRPRLPEPVESPAGEPALPHTEKLAREAPELLRRYAIRCLYAEAVNPRFFSAILYVPRHAYLWHAESPEMQELIEPEVAKGAIELGNGWKWRYDNAVDAQGDAARLEAELAPLAQNPTMEQLDAMLPPVPDVPFLSLRKGWAFDHDGEPCYGALLVIPESYPLGQFTLKAYEITRRKPLRFDNIEFENSESKSHFWDMRVYSGDEGQYYGSVWEIWFTPADGGESRCVATQEFLITGN